MKKILLIALFALVVLSLAPVSAGNLTITMANPGGIAVRDMVVYFPNGTMYGYYNSTSVIDLDTNSSYIFTMKPLSSNPLEDPADWLVNTAFPFVSAGAIALIVLIFLARLWK